MAYEPVQGIFDGSGYTVCVFWADDKNRIRDSDQIT